MKVFSMGAKAVTVVAIACAVGCAGAPKPVVSGEATVDSVITSKVKAAILNEPTVKSMEINVETFKSRVQLSGFVNTQANASTAMEAARGVAGVVDVKDDMRLK